MGPQSGTALVSTDVILDAYRNMRLTRDFRPHRFRNHSLMLLASELR
jgi:hypothetical protein